MILACSQQASWLAASLRAVANGAAVIATSDPRASDAGAGILRDGGNAVDAAVAAALVLYVVEPQSCGIGGDAFLLHVAPGSAVEGLDGAGAVPAGLTTEALTGDGLDRVPGTGGRSVTVPGAIGLLEEALRRYGTATLADLMIPAVDAASRGFAVRETLARAAARVLDALVADPVLGPLYAPDGRPVQVGDTVTNPALADALTTLARNGSAALYGGTIGKAVAARVQADGGYLTIDDLAAHRTDAMDPESASFRGVDVWELPRPTQGPAVLLALRALDESGPPVDWNHVVKVVDEGLRSVGFDVRAIVRQPPPPPARGDTTFIACIDREGRAASLITSVFGEFGSHLGVDALAGPIHNRAASFRMSSEPLRRGKPPHTTIPSIVTRDGELELVLGVAGGLAQPQAQVQILIRMLDERLGPQEAIDAPRFKVLFGGGLALEPGHPLGDRFVDALGRDPGPEGFGGAQVARRASDGSLTAGADPRRGGAVAFA